MTAATEDRARTIVMGEAERIVARYVGGREKTTNARYLFARISDLRGQALEDALTAARRAYNQWLLAPDAATRDLLEQAIETLCGGPR